MRVLMVQTFYYYRGGDSTYMLNLSGLLEEQGHEVIPFAMHHPDNLPSPYSEYFVSEIDFPSLLGEFSPRAAWKVLSRSMYNREARGKMESLVEKVKPDIVHMHNFQAHLTTSIIGPIKKRNIPIVWTLHDSQLVCPNSSLLCGDEICERCIPNRYYMVLLHRCKKGSLAASFLSMVNAYYNRLIRLQARIDRFITPSNFLRNKMIEGGYDPGKITWMPNFVDLNAYRPSPEKDYFLFFGRLAHEKAPDMLVRAVSRLDTGRLWIVGDGPLREDLVNLAAELGADRVEFIGYRTGDELRKIIAEAQFAVLPSRVYDNFPFSVLEAMASGKAVVASDSGGVPEMVEDGVNGYLFPIGDVDALVDRLNVLLGDGGRRRDMGQRGREKAERLYSREEHYRRIVGIYEQEISRAGH